MTLVVGVDVTVVARIAALLERQPRFAERIFTPGERRISTGKPQRWASRWAAKEAVRKLCSSQGDPMPAYRDIEVVRGRGGPPRVHVRGEPTPIALSLTHDGGLAIAVAVSERPRREAALPDVPSGVLLADRPDDGHKGTFGRVVVIAGSKALSGAPRLAGGLRPG